MTKRRPASDFDRIIIPLCGELDEHGRRCIFHEGRHTEHQSFNRWTTEPAVSVEDAGPFGDSGAAVGSM